MKNKILIGIVVLLILLIISVRYIFNNRFAEFKISVKTTETATEQLDFFRIEKEKKIAMISNEGLSQLFNQYYH